MIRVARRDMVRSLYFRNYSAKKIQKVLDTVFLIFFNLSRRRTLVTRHLLAEAQALAERA
jgi:hypothetical protein